MTQRVLRAGVRHRADWAHSDSGRRNGGAHRCETSLTLREGWAFEDVRPYAEQAVDAYFQELAKQWAGSDALVVRVSQIETRLLELDGVIDVGDTALDGVPGKQNAWGG